MLQQTGMLKTNFPIKCIFISRNKVVIVYYANMYRKKVLLLHYYFDKTRTNKFVITSSQQIYDQGLSSPQQLRESTAYTYATVAENGFDTKTARFQ